MSLKRVAKLIQRKLCTEDVVLLRTEIQPANEPYQEPAEEPTETEYTFKGGVNPMKAKASVDNAGLKIPADWSVIVTIEDFQKRTGITIDGKRLDWVHHCRLKVRGAFCSISHAHITGPGGIWLTLFASREQ